jgi:hypothetical protein
MQFLSDNAAAVHPAVWKAMLAADAPAPPYDGDALSRELDARFSGLFGRDCAVLWVATGTAANCLALAAMVPPHGGVICHREAHIEMDEGGAPGFFLHGAKLLLAEGEGAKITDPASVFAFRDHLTFLDRIMPEAHVKMGLKEQAASLRREFEQQLNRQGHQGHRQNGVLLERTHIQRRPTACPPGGADRLGKQLIHRPPGAAAPRQRRQQISQGPGPIGEQ